ncbi:ABC transporter ATP-binding protein [Phycicoccus endophyticus]|uniref:ABC transporter ATP-binding protein n=1 Tax=Phycicoccus endophyticus TaxID=1690220 RepID=A0A7G9R0Q2_9MICO|nr:ABC transporter ATP-binding protein [Phycicoccus endophyticus]NHI19461.1 ABC transporter ATP-binding protein [Phycicoccus endophyticus]QNN49177.1 ABC transporter ATP-binding protein [Phycicoccus endophyticus]GGL39357.1 ABC transporter [Phycicoccus endophyticus]
MSDPTTTGTPEAEGTPTPAGHVDTSPDHLERVATTDAARELPPERSGFGEGVVGEVLLDIQGLSKSFGSVHANRDITLTVRRGEIVALLGENGAGKSTLVNQIFGLIAPDAGTVSVKGDATPIKDPKDAIGRGIGMVHQHFQLVPVMTVAENLMLGHETTRAGVVLDLEGARRMVRDLAERHGLRVDPDAEVDDLPVGTQQRVEILKALSRRVDLLILDEPTAVLTPQETDELLGVMRELAASGTSIVFITHKLREVLAVADRVYVLRQGAVVGEVATGDTDATGLATMMVGREVVLSIDKEPATPGETVLSIRDLRVEDDRELTAVDGFSLEVRAGEIVGVAGVEGNGQRELVEALAGMRKVVSGQMTLGDLDLTRADPHRTHHAGVGHIPENREKHGLVSAYSIADNLVLNEFDQPPYARSGVRQFAAVRENAQRLREEFDIRSSGVMQTAGSLSGGNKQKVVVAREMSFEPRLLMAAQPTRGVDVGSIEFIHRRIVQARDQGAAVLLVSAELDEILSLSDRIAVVHGGKVVAEMAAADADRTEIGRLMAGDH